MKISKGHLVVSPLRRCNLPTSVRLPWRPDCKTAFQTAFALWKRTHKPQQIMAERNISILIPCFNRFCAPLVKTLHDLAAATQSPRHDAFNFEIIVADDKSSRVGCVEANREINALPHCRLLEMDHNVGRAEIRNVLAQNARYEWLVFLDCDVNIPDSHFLQNYLQCDERHEVVYGGVSLPPFGKRFHGNLRYRYEKRCLPKFSVENRLAQPYQSFRTCNFMVSKQTLLNHPFDGRIRTYGYEDVLFGKSLTAAHIPVHHIDNPVEIDDFEDNGNFMYKTEEAMQTLFRMRDLMDGYSLITHYSAKIDRWNMRRPLLLFFRRFGKMMRKSLRGKHPSVSVYNLYRLLYYLSLEDD